MICVCDRGIEDPRSSALKVCQDNWSSQGGPDQTTTQLHQLLRAFFLLLLLLLLLAPFFPHNHPPLWQFGMACTPLSHSSPPRFASRRRAATSASASTFSVSAYDFRAASDLLSTASDFLVFFNSLPFLAINFQQHTPLLG